MPEAATLSSSEAVRDREPSDSSDREPAREPEAKPEAPRSAFADIAERMRGTEEKLAGAAERRSASERDYAREVMPAIQMAQQSVREAGAAREAALARSQQATPTVTKPPSRKLTDFLAPVQGEAPEQSVSKMMQALGQLAMGLGVGGKKDARAALAAWAGALKGWQEGDKERADRSFKDWQANTDAALKQWEVQRTSAADIIKNAELSMEDKFRLLNLLKLQHEITSMPDVHDEKTLGDLLTHQERQAQIAATMENSAARLADSKQRAEESNRIKEESNRIRQDFFKGLLSLRDLSLQESLGKSATGNYWDAVQGRPRQISVSEQIADLQRVSQGERPRFKHLNVNQEMSLDRLRVAPPILERLEVLVKRITAEAPGENITQGLIQKLKKRAGIGADIQQIQNLNVDLATEVAGALSGGQPRITILQMIRGEGQASASMTTEVALGQISTARTTLKNRVTGITEDPTAWDRLSGGMEAYQDAPKPAKKGDPLGIRR